MTTGNVELMHKCCPCPRKISTGMVKTGLTQRYLSDTYAVKYLLTLSHWSSQSAPHMPCHSDTQATNEQMSMVASVSHSTATMRNICSSKIILPGVLRVCRQVRNEKYRSVRRTIPCRLRARSPQSEEKVLLQTHCIAMLASLSQHSRNEKNELTK